MTNHEIQIDVQGMTCGHCERAVISAFSELPGVDEVTADREAGSVSLRVGANWNTSEAQVRALIEEEGFTFGGIVEGPESA